MMKKLVFWIVCIGFLSGCMDKESAVYIVKFSGDIPEWFVSTDVPDDPVSLDVVDGVPQTLAFETTGNSPVLEMEGVPLAFSIAWLDILIKAPQFSFPYEMRVTFDNIRLQGNPITLSHSVAVTPTSETIDFAQFQLNRGEWDISGGSVPQTLSYRIEIVLSGPLNVDRLPGMDFSIDLSNLIYWK